MMEQSPKQSQSSNNHKDQFKQGFLFGEATHGNGKQNEVQFALALNDKVYTTSMTYKLFGFWSLST